MSLWLRCLTFGRLLKAFLQNRLYLFFPFLFVLVLLKVFLVLNGLASPIAPFVYSLF